MIRLFEITRSNQKERGRREGGRGLILLWRSEALQVVVSQEELRKAGDLHTQVLLERLPQPEAGRAAA